MSRLPLTALDIQLDLLRHYSNTEHGRMYAETIVQAGLNDDGLRPGLGRALHQAILGTGATFAVTRDIVDILEQAAPSVPSFILHESDLPVPRAFVWLERPIVVRDIRDHNLVVRAFGWHVAGMHHPDGTLAEERAMTVVAWTEPTDPRDHAATAWREDAIQAAFNSPHGLMSMVGGVWQLGRNWDAELEGHPFDLGWIVLAFLRFIDEPWINTERFIPDRHLAKRAARTLDHVPEVHVVQLRRAVAHGPTDPGAGNVEWTHRWLVRGHWRNQWYPSLNTHKPRWIAEHIKGPDDMPLIVHDKIFSVER